MSQVRASLVALLALSLVAAPVAANGRALKANLSGANEVDAAGDTDGSGWARLRLNQGRGRICYKIQVTSVTVPATAAHIHNAAAGVNGPVVVTLGAPDANGYAEGCVTGLARPLVKAIRQHKADYYVNVHTSDFPAGAVRGQLQRWAPGRP